MDNISLGRQGETMAASYLSAHGYTVLQRNYSCPMGELDIVARQGDVVAFVEVKTRRSLRYGLASLIFFLYICRISPADYGPITSPQRHFEYD